MGHGLNDRPRGPAILWGVIAAAETTLQIRWLQPGVLGNPGQHLRADLLVLVESEHVIAALGVVQLDVGTALGYYSPTFSEKSA